MWRVTDLPINLFTSYPPTYSPIIYMMLMLAKIWYIKYESITLNELTTILIIFLKKIIINDN
jgi:hypothetical protein